MSGPLKSREINEIGTEVFSLEKYGDNHENCFSNFCGCRFISQEITPVAIIYRF